MMERMVRSGCCGGDCCRTSQGKKLSGKGLVVAIMGAVALGLLLIGLMPRLVEAQDSEKQAACITKGQVEKAVEANQCLVIVEGKVYDFTENAKKWNLEGHVGQHPCGKEYSPEVIEQGPHGREVVEKFYVGLLCEVSPEPVAAAVSPVEQRPVRQPLVILGMTMRRLSSYLALLFFLLNFMTCYAMPWARKGAPWAGDKPGPDEKDTIGHFPFTHWHAYFAWAAIFFLALHGVLGFGCALLGKCL